MSGRDCATTTIPKSPDDVLFIGLGAIGEPMATTLLNEAFRLTVYDVRDEPLERLARAGARIAPPNPGIAAASATIAVLMVATPSQAIDALFGSRGIAASLKPDSTVIVCSTVGMKTVEHIEARLSERAIHTVDAPVSGGTKRAAEGDLLIMASGPEPAVRAATPVLNAMGSRTAYVGSKVGQGQAMKLVNQLLCGVNLAAVAEALAFAECLGIEPSHAYDVIRSGAANSFMLEDRAPRMIAGASVPIKSALDIFVKDTDLVVHAAQQCGIDAQLAATANRLFHAAKDLGLGRADDSQVCKVYALGHE